LRIYSSRFLTQPEKERIMMKSKLLNSLILAALALPGVAMAEDSPFSGNVSLTTNYLYRGWSQTGNNAAIQGGFDYANPNGIYAGVWGSSISWLGDLGIMHSGTELDTYVGYGSSFATDFSYDVGYLRYNYPGYYGSNTNADTDEFHGKIGYKWVSLKYSYTTSNIFGFADTKCSTYLEVNGSYDVGPVSLAAHYGKQKYGGSGCVGCDYADYNVSVSKDFSGYTYALLYSNTDVSGGGLETATGAKLADGKVVLTLSHSM
jgi:uncharacterized protein (TIGR02001 family)